MTTPSKTALFVWSSVAAVLVAPATALGQDLDPSVVGKLLDFNKLTTAGLIAIAAFIGARVASAALDNLGERLVKRRLQIKRVASLLRFGIYISAALIITLGVLRPERETLIAISATLAVTIGFALKDLAGSIIAGVIVLVDAPFQVGDRVKFGDTYGEVVEIGLRTVKIKTLDDNLVSIPNNKFLTDAVASANAGALDMMIVLDFFIGIDEDHERARDIVLEATLTSRYVYLAKAVVVHVSEEAVGGEVYGTRLRSKFYVCDARFESAIQTDITRRVKFAFRNEGVSGPYVKSAPSAR
jgi:small-conductance mechanosensitive channel